MDVRRVPAVADRHLARGQERIGTPLSYADVLWVVTENAAARHVYDKVGFTEDGRHRECFRCDAAGTTCT